jgi:hypothetical protein
MIVFQGWHGSLFIPKRLKHRFRPGKAGLGRPGPCLTKRSHGMLAGRAAPYSRGKIHLSGQLRIRFSRTRTHLFGKMAVAVSSDPLHSTGRKVAVTDHACGHGPARLRKSKFTGKRKSVKPIVSATGQVDGQSPASNQSTKHYE